MIDLVEINESKYIEVNFQTGYVFIAYNPSNHLLFLRFSKTKQSEVMTEYLKEMIQYLDKNKNRIENVQFTEVVMDEGTEFKGEFTELLDEEQIKIRRVDPHKEDHRQLAPLNAMCKFVRDQIFKRFIAMDKQDQNGEVPLKIMVTSASINKIVKEVTEFHNFSRKIKPYDKTPAEVTVDDIEQFNQMKSEMNQDVETKYKFDIGDVVKI